MDAKEFLIAHTGLQESIVDHAFKWVVAAMEAYKLEVANRAWDACNEYTTHLLLGDKSKPNKEEYLKSLK